MTNNRDNTVTKVLGDINPEPDRSPSRSKRHSSVGREDIDDKSNDSTDEGSRHGESQHSGSRDVTEATTGGTGTETGGTRNFRTGSGATGTDIGNRPE